MVLNSLQSAQRGGVLRVSRCESPNRATQVILSGSSPDTDTDINDRLLISSASLLDLQDISRFGVR